MKMYIPSIGDAIVLTDDWSFQIQDEYRNDTMYSFFTDPTKGTTLNDRWGRKRTYKPISGVLLKDTVLTIDRLYVKKGMKDFDSITFSVKKMPVQKKGRLRFWVKLKELDTLEFEKYENKQ